MIDINNFHVILGATIMACQTIEHDIKLMYAGMMEGDFDKNFALVKNKAMGEVLVKLKELDNSDNKPFFSPSDYDLLFEIKNIRNYWVHKGYADFVYNSGDAWHAAFSLQYRKLNEVYQRLMPLSKETERIRITLMKTFGR